MTKYAVKISEQGQITLPKALRNKISAQNGNRVILTIDDGSNTINVSKKYPIENYFGKFGSNIAGGEDPTSFVKSLREEDSAKHNGMPQ